MSSVAREKRDVSGFTRVAHRGVGEVHIAQGEVESLEIEAPDSIMSRLTAQVTDGTLQLGYNHDWMNFFDWVGGFFAGASQIRFYVTLPVVEGISLSGAGNVEAAGLRADRLEISMSGAGNIKIGELSADSLIVAHKGAGNVEIQAGRCVEQDVTLSGAGNYRGGSFRSLRARVRLKGMGNAEVLVKESLDAEISGLGNIRYRGNPSVKQRVTGLGKLQSLGEK